MSNLFENLQLMKEVDTAIVNKAKNKYRDIYKYLTSKKGEILEITGKDNHNDIACTYLINAKKIVNNKYYIHTYIIDTLLPGDFNKDVLDKIQNVKYINKFFDIIKDLNRKGYVKAKQND